ncbi:MAG: peptidoglycan editing factor PgeF [Nitrosomonas sp.]|nr:peptidoglycan editing factor PgeF [Nitrosomonas sp.]MCP5251073.1 peptidoglycan editing factor PgeF [Burkholderiales bacterium]
MDYIVPNWPAPDHVRALFTTRSGGVSENTGGAYASLNLGMHVNDNPDRVLANRRLLRQHLPNEPQWLEQVHGVDHIRVERAAAVPLRADAALSDNPGAVCAVMVADCLPVYLCDSAGSAVGIVHAGWRGLSAGIVEKSVAGMRIEPERMMAWLGPAIGPAHFEVGDEVRAIFVDHDPYAAIAFKPASAAAQVQVQVESGSKTKWYADIFQLARLRLQAAGVTRIYGGGICTYSDPARFFSYRRDGVTGRMAALIWLESSGMV